MQSAVRGGGAAASNGDGEGIGAGFGAGTDVASAAATALVLAGAFGAFLGFALLFPVIPEYAARGGAGELGAGFATTVFILFTVVVQPVAARMLSEFGHRVTLVVGVVLLGPPALLPLMSDRLAVIDVSSVLRGAGFGVFVVAGVATIVDLPPEWRRGRNLGLYGAVSGAAGVVGAPAGTWLIPRVGYSPVFVVAAVAPLVMVVGARAIRLPRPQRTSRTSRTPRMSRAQRQGRRLPAAVADPVVRRLFLIEAASTVGYGVAFTFLPLSAPARPTWVVPAAFLVQQLSATVARWLVGVWADRRGAGRILRPAVVLAALGLASCACPQDPAILLVGMALFGAGFGMVQNATLLAMLDGTDTASASVAWNLAFDGGTGIGAAGGALVFQAAGPAVMFVAVAGAVLLTAVPRLARSVPR